MTTLWKKEMLNYYLSPLGYVFMGFFLLMSGVFFALFNLNSGSSELSTLFGNMIYLFMVLTPLLTMRLISEERRAKTDQLLITSPLSIRKIVVGKYLAACTVLFLTLVCTLPYIAIIGRYATVYPGLVFSNYLGFFMMGCCYIAIGVLMSSLTESQLTAAVLTMSTILLTQVIDSVAPTITIPNMNWLKTVIKSLSLYSRYDLCAAGIISPADIIYFISFCAAALMFSVEAIDRGRWKES